MPLRTRIPISAPVTLLVIDQPSIGVCAEKPDRVALGQQASPMQHNHGARAAQLLWIRLVEGPVDRGAQLRGVHTTIGVGREIFAG